MILLFTSIRQTSVLKFLAKTGEEAESINAIMLSYKCDDQGFDFRLDKQLFPKSSKLKRGVKIRYSTRNDFYSSISINYVLFLPCHRRRYFYSNKSSLHHPVTRLQFNIIINLSDWFKDFTFCCMKYLRELPELRDLYGLVI